MQYSQADRQLARALIAVDLEGLAHALAAGAAAHKEPFKGVSWSLIPLYYAAAKDGVQADLAVAKQMMRDLISAGSPIKGLAHFIGSGYAFSRDDFNYLLDNWLWRDAEELKMVATRCLHNDDMMLQIVGTGQVEASLPVEGGMTLFDRICLNGLYRSAFEFAGLGAKLDAKITVDGEVVPLVEAAARKGQVGVVNALLRSGAFYEPESLAQQARHHSPKCEALVAKSMAAFEMGMELPDEDVHNQMLSPDLHVN